MIITLEGLDASGKSSQIKLLTEYFENIGKKVKNIHFPIYGHNMYSDMISKFLRGEYGDNNEVDPLFVANIYAMDRYMYKEEMNKIINENDVVIIDRYVFSNLAYQGSKISDDKREWFINEIKNFEFNFLRLPYPDFIIFFDVPIEEIERRLNGGRNGDDREYLKGKQDIHEKNIDFQKKVRDIYMNLKNNKNYFIINAYNEKGILNPIDLFNQYLKIIS